MPDTANGPQSDNPPLHLRTLGVVELRAEGAESVLLGMGKPLALLIYLAAAPGRMATRSQLISLLWADLEPEGAKHAVRQAIWYIRRKVGADIVIPVGESLRLHQMVMVDRDALLAASDAGDHAAVVERYAGPYVRDFASPGGSGFEDWCSLERRRLRQVFQHSAEALVAAWLAQGRSRVALDLARRLRDEDLFDERAWRLLLEVCVSAGDLLAGRAEAEALEQLAEHEKLELEPSTRALLRVVRSPEAKENGTRAAPDGPLQSPSLVGREHAFSQLLGAWEHVRGSGGAMQRVHITARAGLGKSRLLRDLQSRLKAMRAKVVSVGGQYGARDVVFGLASELAAALATLPGRRAISPGSAATLIALNPSISTYFDDAPRASSNEDPMRARTLAMRELASAVSFENPIALLIDDLHWADDQSLAFLSAFADGARESRILLVTTGRREARQADVAAHADTLQLSLEPLNAQQVEELVLGIASLPNASWGSELTQELWRVSRGSPLLALETLQLLEERGVLRRESGQWNSDVPDTLLAELRAGDALRGRLEELDRRDRWLLTLLAVAGSNVDEETLRDAAEPDRPDADARIRQLESRGFVVRAGDGWQLAHDELLDEVLRVATPDGSARAAARLAEAMLGHPTWDERRARRAAQLLRTSGTDAMRREVFRRFARERYAAGDRRPLRALAADLLGSGAHDENVRSVVRGAPLSWRLGLVSPARQATAVIALAALMVASVIIAVYWRTQPSPDAVLGIAVLRADGHVALQSVELREKGWNPLDPLTTEKWEEFREFDIQSSNAFDVTRRLDGSAIVTSQPVDDSGVIELFLHERNRAPRRIAPHAGDDNRPRFSPDGRFVAFVTARWDSLSHYDLALYDTYGDSVIQLTHTPGTDDWPTWSPSGTRIAFTRSNWGEGPNELCTLVVATRVESCRATPEGENSFPVGWIDEDRILAMSGLVGAPRLVALEWSTNAIIVIRDAQMDDVRMSPDGRWVYCSCQLFADGRMGPAIFPLQAPSLIRAIQMSNRQDQMPTGRLYPFWISSRASIEPTRLKITAPRIVQAHVPAKLHANLSDETHPQTPYMGSLRWSVGDSLGASIDAISGLLMLNGASPSVKVFARAGLVARDSVVVSLVPSAATVVFAETWNDTTLREWIPFGLPIPRVQRTRDGTNVLQTNGEGSFTSGVISTQTFDAAAGLAVEARFTGKITMKQWQNISIGILDNVDTAAYRASRGHNLIPGPGHRHYSCEFTWPNERNAGQSIIGSLTNDVTVLAIDSVTLGFAKAAWHTIRLQLLPDTRCAVAIDGAPIAITRWQARFPSTARILISGSSYATDLVVGSVRVYGGVPNDVDWRKAKIVQ